MQVKYYQEKRKRKYIQSYVNKTCKVITNLLPSLIYKYTCTHIEINIISMQNKSKPQQQNNMLQNKVKENKKSRIANMHSKTEQNLVS